MSDNPEIGQRIAAAGIETNYHDMGNSEQVLLLLHGSGPGVSAWANWRLVLPALSRQFRVLAPDAVGFGFTERPQGIHYSLEGWRRHITGFMDAVSVQRAHVVGNSFGGALALSLAIHHPDRIRRLVLMGSVGLDFALTEGLDRTWGYTPSLENMRALLDLFAYDRSLVTDELAELRYQASIRPGFQESFSQMFPAPRQAGIRALASPEQAIAGIDKETLIIHGREDQVIPLECSQRLHALVDRSQLHVFGRCGHWTQIEHTERFNRLVADFVTEPEG